MWQAAVLGKTFGRARAALPWVTFVFFAGVGDVGGEGVLCDYLVSPGGADADELKYLT